MFGLSLSRRVIQGPAIRSWNSITHFANLLWCKFSHTRNSIMPRSRRRFHSRSRSRSRSHSYDRGREVKRRRIDSGGSSPYRRSISREASSRDDNIYEICDTGTEICDASTETDVIPEICDTTAEIDSNSEICKTAVLKECKVLLANCDLLAEKHMSEAGSTSSVYCDTTDSELNNSEMQEKSENGISELQQPIKSLTSKTPKPLTPGQQKKFLERQKVRDAKLAEKRQKLEAKLKIKQEKDEQRQREKQEKKDLKQKEIDEKQKEKDLKDEQREQKKKEREEKDEQKRKEKEEKKDLKRKELEEKEKEKQKQEEKKQRVSSMFVNFFKRKTDNIVDEKKFDNVITMNFMPFKVKADMKIAPLTRRTLTAKQKGDLISNLQNSDAMLYLEELKCGKKLGKSERTWQFENTEDEDDVVLIDDSSIGQTVEDVQKTRTFHAKLLKFHENRRPPYFGTWRKKSTIIRPRNPLGIDKKYFDYEVDTDDEWEEEDSGGESLRGSDDEDKENEGDNDYEVDNEFFVPHGHLSDDELNDEETAIETPEAHKAKLRLLKKEFEEEMKGQTHKLKGRVIGCVWEKKNDTIDNAIYNFLKPFSILSNGPIIVKKRSELSLQMSVMRKSIASGKPLSVDLIPTFLKFIHGNTNKLSVILNEFLTDLSNKGINTEVSKSSLKKQAKEFAEWIRNPENGPMHQKYCWYVNKDTQQKYNLELEVSG